MPTKLNITPGPWQYHHKRYNTYNRESVSLGSIISGVWYIAEVQNSCNENKLSDDEESEANAVAIVTAVNNTYHKGINPEAVPEMLEAIKMCRALFESMGLQEQSRIGGEQYKFIKITIQKASL